jgi:hypothetical protein
MLVPGPEQNRASNECRAHMPWVGYEQLLLLILDQHHTDQTIGCKIKGASSKHAGENQARPNLLPARRCLQVRSPGPTSAATQVGRLDGRGRAAKTHCRTPLMPAVRLTGLKSRGATAEEPLSSHPPSLDASIPQSVP